VYGLLLESIDLYVRSHFGFEEGCMNRAHCPVAQKNSESHAQFINVLAGFEQRYARDGFDNAHARKLLDTIDAWLSDHICRIDVQLKPFSHEV